MINKPYNFLLIPIITIFLFINMNLWASDSLDINTDELMPKISLILSGGGARGFSQIGVLYVLELNNIIIDNISGTSMGALIGGLYASGYTVNEISNIASHTNWDEILNFNLKQTRNSQSFDYKYIYDRSLLSFEFNDYKFITPKGFSDSYKLDLFLRELLYNARYKPINSFDDLKVKLRIAACDIVSGKTHIFNSGNIIKAIRASSSIPLQYSPVKVDSMLLIDGGIFDNIPQSASNQFVPDIKITVKNTSPLYNINELNNAVDIADQILSVSMKYFEKKDELLSGIIIEPNLNKYENNNFKNVSKLILQGKIATSKKINIIKDTLDYIVSKKFKHLLSSKYNLNAFKYIVDKTNKQNYKYDKYICKQIINYDTLLLYESIKIKESNDTLILIKTPHTNITNINIISENSIKCKLDLANLSQNINEKYIGQTINRNIKESIKNRILDTLFAYGYSFARINKFNILKNGCIDIVIAGGIVQKINISGTKNTAKFLIKREFNFKFPVKDTSDTYCLNSNDLLSSWINLKGNSLFKTIDFNYKYSDDKIDLDIQAEENGNQGLNIGFRIDNYRNFRLASSIIKHNLFNSGTFSAADIIIGERDYHFGYKLSNSRISYSQVGLSIYSYYDKKIYPGYYENPNETVQTFYNQSKRNNINQEVAGINLAFTSKILDRGALKIGLRYEKQRTNYTDKVKNLEWHSINNIFVNSEFDTENKIAFSDRGYYLNLLFESNFISIHNNIPYSKILANMRYNITYKQITISPSLFIAAADKSLPLEEYFSMGGIDDFYGMQEYQMRGQQKLLLSMEGRYLLPYNLLFNTYIGMRYDYGNIWETSGMIDFNYMKHGMGIYTAVETPLGPAKLAIGRSFYFERNEINAIVSSKFIFYFSIGVKL